jgi:2-keto-3-deoxy-L-fuconate dehydrogenase
VDQVALVTGADTGIGWAIATRLQADGFALAFHTRDDEDDAKARSEEIAAKGRTEWIVGDLSDSDACGKVVREALEKLGGIDVLVNNAGISTARPVLELTAEDFDKTFAVDVRAAFLLSTSVAREMKKKGGGSIINMSSAASSIRGVPNRYVYSLTKAAVIGLTKATAMDFIKRGVRVNAICPGTIESPSFRDRVAAHAKRSGISLQDAEKDFIDRQPMGRIGTAEEVAMLATYLASDESAFISGHIHLIDGGWAL